VGLGVFVLKVSGEGRRLRMPYGVAYSFDMLLPVIPLRDKITRTRSTFAGAPATTSTAIRSWAGCSQRSSPRASLR
jgi:hypothetical protein